MSKKTRKVTYINHTANLICEGWRYLEDRETQMCFSTNHRHYCPTCGDIWLTEMTEFAEGFSFLQRPCVKHSKNGYIGGVLLATLIAGIDKARLEGAPLALLQYEFLLMGKHQNVFKD